MEYGAIVEMIGDNGVCIPRELRLGAFVRLTWMEARGRKDSVCEGEGTTGQVARETKPTPGLLGSGGGRSVGVGAIVRHFRGAMEEGHFLLLTT